VTSRRPLILASNRGPVGFSRDESGKLVEKRGAGGLVTALRPLVARHDVTWIASAQSDEDRRVAGDGAVDQTAQDGSAYRLRLIAHDSAAYDLFYNVVANPALWFAQHGLEGMLERRRSELQTAWERGYVPVNQAFADAVADELAREPRAAVFFQDYHLYAAPALLRSRCPHALLAQFVHIPWPTPEEWRVLPDDVVLALHEGLLANDVVGFHTERWRRAFLASCEELGLETAGTLVTAHPISVDAAEFDEAAAGSAVLAREEVLRRERPEQLIVRVDRTDPSKNVVRGFHAFRRLLDRRPDLLGRVGMLALLDPSRQTIPEYAHYRAAIEREAAALSDAYPGVLTVRIADDFPESVAAYKQYDVLLVNAERDGLNLVAKEAPLVNTQDGVVVLSENAGAYDELREWVIGVDPFDVDAQSIALERALELPAEQRVAWAEAIERHVREHDLERWATEQLEDLDRVSTIRS
jgi:trehalose 6-phosphate synthase